jgi:predicted short-subunit dehydrogenase-like oxidoreductase (DUF2520 family)
MKKITPIKLCIIGVGRLGATMCRAFSEGESNDVKLVAVSSRTKESLEKAKKAMGGKTAGVFFTKNNREAAIKADCILICTPDDIIKKVCDEIFKDIKSGSTGKYCVVHFSGSKTLDVIKTAGDAGAGTASIHPLKSFASVDEAIKTLPGTVYGITYSGKRSKGIAEKLVGHLGGEIILIDDKKKPLYHAGACVASNYMVTMLNYAAFLHQKIGINPEDSLKGLINLSEGTLKNIKKMGTKKSLTGPIARGDTGTIKEHMVGFNKLFTEEEKLIYKIMGRETAKIAYQNKWIKSDTLKKLKKILEE